MQSTNTQIQTQTRTSTQKMQKHKYTHKNTRTYWAASAILELSTICTEVADCFHEAHLAAKKRVQGGTGSADRPRLDKVPPPAPTMLIETQFRPKGRSAGCNSGTTPKQTLADKHYDLMQITESVVFPGPVVRARRRGFRTPISALRETRREFGH
jgi:hypothetical protein